MASGGATSLSSDLHSLLDLFGPHSGLFPISDDRLVDGLGRVFEGGGIEAWARTRAGMSQKAGSGPLLHLISAFLHRVTH